MGSSNKRRVLFTQATLMLPLMSRERKNRISSPVLSRTHLLLLQPQSSSPRHFALNKARRSWEIGCLYPFPRTPTGLLPTNHRLALLWRHTQTQNHELNTRLWLDGKITEDSAPCYAWHNLMTSSTPTITVICSVIWVYLGILYETWDFSGIVDEGEMTALKEEGDYTSPKQLDLISCCEESDQVSLGRNGTQR